MLAVLRWIRLVSIMALPALGTAGLLLGTHGDPVQKLGEAVKVVGLGVVPVIMFIGFTASVFSFPSKLGKAVAVTLLTPALLLGATLAMGWGVWSFFVDECFAELVGMGLGAAAAGLVHGGGGLGVRLLGAAVFGGGAVGAMVVFGAPMMASGQPELLWWGLNGLALAWSLYTYFELFSDHAKGDAEAPPAEGGEAGGSSYRGLTVVGAIGAWLVAAIVATAVALG